VALARRVATLHQQNTDAHQITVVATEPEIAGEWDAARLERALDNLIGNAVKYSPGGGTVTVSLARDEAQQAAILSVRDEGLGIPAGDLPHIFERFHRAGNVGRIPGTGVGLAAVRQIVEQHGGPITVDSAPGQGSTFTVRLPLHAPSASAESAV